MIDKLLVDTIRNEVPTDNVGILLSGGVDSLSLGFAAHRLGKKITAYTFHLEDDKSYDANKAEEVSKEFGWECKTVVVPTTNLKDDFLRLVRNYDCRKKTHFECTFPFLYVFPHIKESYLLSGIGADGYYGVSKKAILHFKEPKEKFDQFRRNYFTPFNVTGFRQIEQLSNERDIKLVHPYIYHDDVREFFFKYDWFELNQPKQKQVVRDAFKEEFDRVTSVKDHINLQLGSNIDHLFEKLLDDKMLNNRGRKRVMDLASDYASTGQAILPL
jgi:asparagine synthetase B (glutamine-hydrolysing)